ncbi:TPA_asm: hypothetical protein [Pseudomonas phage vB_PaeS-D14H]|nr:TPA_asm: hypothetical protein [Pseudomonas phage vB_PaeS-D14H]
MSAVPAMIVLCSLAAMRPMLFTRSPDMVPTVVSMASALMSSTAPTTSARIPRMRIHCSPQKLWKGLDSTITTPAREPGTQLDSSGQGAFSITQYQTHPAVPLGLPQSLQGWVESQCHQQLRSRNLEQPRQNRPRGRNEYLPQLQGAFYGRKVVSNWEVGNFQEQSLDGGAWLHRGWHWTNDGAWTATLQHY